MNLTHGSSRFAILHRINQRAVALVNLGTDADLHDPTDINHAEDKEIEFAKALAAEWTRGNAIEAWHLPGVNEFIATPEVKLRLEYLRGELRAERISYGEIAELQGLAQHIDRSDVELLEAAGVPEKEEV